MKYLIVGLITGIVLGFLISFIFFGHYIEGVVNSGGLVVNDTMAQQLLQCYRGSH